MILIISPASDPHAACVGQDLKAKGVPFRQVDSTRLTLEGRLSFHAGRDRSSVWTDLEGHPVELEKIRTIWHRRRFMPEVPALPAEADRNYFRREWTEFFAGVFASLDAWFVNDPARQEQAVKPLQLRLASAIGLAIPDTLITNDPVAAQAFVDRHEGRIVHKALSPPRHRFLATKKWEPSDAAALPDLVLAPAIFQEMVTDCRELRVTVIGERVFAAEFRPAKGLIDGRLDLETPYARHELPKSIESQILTFVRRLGLVFSTMDFKLTESGEYVFLELNPMGQYLYVEILSGMPLTAAMAELLVRGQPT